MIKPFPHISSHFCFCKKCDRVCSGKNFFLTTYLLNHWIGLDQAYFWKKSRSFLSASHFESTSNLCMTMTKGFYSHLLWVFHFLIQLPLNRKNVICCFWQETLSIIKLQYQAQLHQQLLLELQCCRIEYIQYLLYFHELFTKNIIKRAYDLPSNCLNIRSKF